MKKPKRTEKTKLLHSINIQNIVAFIWYLKIVVGTIREMRERMTIHTVDKQSQNNNRTSWNGRRNTMNMATIKSENEKKTEKEKKGQIFIHILIAGFEVNDKRLELIKTCPKQKYVFLFLFRFVLLSYTMLLLCGLWLVKSNNST